MRKTRSTIGQTSEGDGAGAQLALGTDGKPFRFDDGDAPCPVSFASGGLDLLLATQREPAPVLSSHPASPNSIPLPPQDPRCKGETGSSPFLSCCVGLLLESITSARAVWRPARAQKARIGLLLAPGRGTVPCPNQETQNQLVDGTPFSLPSGRLWCSSTVIPLSPDSETAPSLASHPQHSPAGLCFEWKGRQPDTRGGEGWWRGGLGL